MLGERLKLAREAAGLNQADAARALRIVESGVSEMENNHREPKAAQLATLARLYDRSLEFFFDEEPVLPEVVLWRERPENEAAAKKIQREFFRLCENYQDLEELTGTARPSILPEKKGLKEKFTYRHAATLANQIWKQLDLGATPAESLRLVLEEKYLVKIFALRLSWTASAASTRNGRFGPAILLSQDNVHWRRNFDLAHELFHLLTWSIFRRPDEPSSTMADADEERLANCFASSLLLPTDLFDEKIQPFRDEQDNLKITLAELHDLARSFGVSAEAVIYRCANLLRWRKEKTQNTIDKIGNFRVWRESEPIEEIPPRYVHLIVQAYRQGLISYNKGAEYLRKSYKQAQDILEPPEDDAALDQPITVTAD